MNRILFIILALFPYALLMGCLNLTSHRQDWGDKTHDDGSVTHYWSVTRFGGPCGTWEYSATYRPETGQIVTNKYFSSCFQ